MPDQKQVVLVVEDIELIRMSAVDLVNDAGYAVLEASNADDAIRILEANPEIALVFTDVEMPGTMDGIKLAHYIRSRWPEVRLMVASGRAILEESSLPSGSRFFSKPYDQHSIVDAIRNLLAGDGDMQSA